MIITLNQLKLRWKNVIRDAGRQDMIVTLASDDLVASGAKYHGSS